MNKTLRNSLALLLSVVLVLGALPFVSAANGGKALYNWSASTVDKDTKAFFSNQVNNAGAKIRWNETGAMYTDQGKQEVVIHNFLNEAAGMGNKTYGLPRVTNAGKTVTQNLKVDLYTPINTEGMKAIALSFVYAYKPDGKGGNVANSELLRISVSKNGMDWLDGTVAMRSAQFVGAGTSAGEPVIYYQIHSEDLMNIAGMNSGDYIRAIRIMPDGESGLAKGVFAMSELTVTGYKSKADFEAAVPVKSTAQGSVEIDEAVGRQALVDAARNSSADTELGVIMDATALITQIAPRSAADLLDIADVSMMEGVATTATDEVKEIFEYLFDRKMMDPAEAAEMLADYETITTTSDIVMDLNTPQQMFRAYAKAKAGDMLVQVAQEEAHVYMVTKVEPVYLPDRVNVDPNKSTATYLTMKGEVTETFFDMMTKKMFVPMILTALAEGKAGTTQVDVYVSMADGVNVAVASDKNITKCVITVGGTTVTVDRPGVSALVCADRKLTDAVAALPNGKHEMTVAVDSGLTGTQTTVVEFEVKDGKATVLGAVAPDHDAVCQSKAMTDVDKNAWYHEAVDYALANGIMAGYSATTFAPNETLSRAMVVQVLYNKEGQPAISGKHSFTDVPADQWFNNAVTWGAKNGVMSGYGDGKFGPNDSVTIQMIAVILWNYSGNPAFTGNADSVGTHSGWAANALSWAVENDILEGVPYENVTGAATRAQTAQMLMNYLTAN